MVVGRTEALIAGWGLEEALSRATAYAEAGADAVLVHSKRKDAHEITAFMEQWSMDTPVVVVPTKYPTTPVNSLLELGISNVIFANQGLRTVVTALQANLRKLHDSLDLMSIENEIVSVEEVFRIQGMGELKSAEARYLPDSSR